MPPLGASSRVSRIVVRVEPPEGSASWCRYRSRSVRPRLVVQPTRPGSAPPRPACSPRARSRSSWVSGSAGCCCATSSPPMRPGPPPKRSARPTRDRRRRDLSVLPAGAATDPRMPLDGSCVALRGGRHRRSSHPGEPTAAPSSPGSLSATRLPLVKLGRRQSGPLRQDFRHRAPPARISRRRSPSAARRPKALVRDSRESTAWGWQAPRQGSMHAPKILALTNAPVVAGPSPVEHPSENPCVV